MRLQMPSFTNLGDLIRRDRNLEKVAVIDLGGEQAPREFTYAHLDAMAHAVARALARGGAFMTVRPHICCYIYVCESTG